MKKKNIATVIICVLAVIAVGVGGWMFYQSRKAEKNPSKTDEWMDALPAASVTIQKELYQSNIENLFYSLDPVEFYEYKEGKLEKAANVQTAKVKTSALFSQAIEFDLTFVRRGREVAGFGEYIAPSSDKVLPATYYFVQAVTMPASSVYKSAENCLLLFDATKGNKAPEDRVYSEGLVYNTQKNAVREYYIANNSRPMTAEGIKRPDYTMFTQELVANATSKRTLYFSGWAYPYENGTTSKTDLWKMEKQYFSEALKDASYLYAHDLSDGTLFFRKNDQGFDAIKRSGKEESVLFQFQGDYETNYLRSGDWLLQKSNLNTEKPVLYDLAGKREIALSGTKAIGEVSGFAVSPDGTKALVCGRSDKTQVVLFCDLKKNQTVVAEGAALFSNTRPLMRFVDNNAFSYQCTDFKAGQPQLCIATWDKVFS